jgi:hypothetical protein
MAVGTLGLANELPRRMLNGRVGTKFRTPRAAEHRLTGIEKMPGEDQEAWLQRWTTWLNEIGAMSVRSPPGIARFDSAAAMVQAIASFLHGHDVANLSGFALLDRTMPAVNYLPRHTREWVYSIGGG